MKNKIMIKLGKFVSWTIGLNGLYFLAIGLTTETSSITHQIYEAIHIIGGMLMIGLALVLVRVYYNEEEK